MVSGAGEGGSNSTVCTAFSVWTLSSLEDLETGAMEGLVTLFVRELKVRVGWAARDDGRLEVLRRAVGMMDNCDEDGAWGLIVLATV